MQGVALIFKSPFKRQKYCKNIVILNSILTEVGDLLWQVLPSNVATWFFMVVFLDHATVIIMTTTVLFVVVVGSCSSSSFLLCLWLLYSGQEETAKAINQSCFLQSALIPQELYHATQLLQLLKPKRRTKDFKRLCQKSLMRQLLTMTQHLITSKGFRFRLLHIVIKLWIYCHP